MDRVIRWFCSHSNVHRERRDLYGAKVLHFVCQDCGHAEPVVPRSESELNAAQPSPVLAPKAKVVTMPSAAERARALEALGI